MILGLFKKIPKDGKGKYEFMDGTFYNGEWKNSKFHGHGALRYAKKKGGRVRSTYVGEFKEGSMHGKGEMKERDNGPETEVRYKGEFKNGKFDGKGDCSYGFLMDGVRYTGEFKDGKRNGKGTATYGLDKYVGEWKDGKENGQGTYTWDSGTKYVGQWKDAKMHGQGTYTMAGGEFAGDKYVGERKDGEMHGQGTYTRANGEIIKGIFKDGKLFKSSTKQPSTSTSASKNKLADELKELKKLYKDGTLTKGEFTKAKSKLLK